LSLLFFLFSISAPVVFFDMYIICIIVFII